MIHSLLRFFSSAFLVVVVVVDDVTVGAAVEVGAVEVSGALDVLLLPCPTDSEPAASTACAEVVLVLVLVLVDVDVEVEVVVGAAVVVGTWLSHRLFVDDHTKCGCSRSPATNTSACPLCTRYQPAQ